jgi:hypothetical protein
MVGIGRPAKVFRPAVNVSASVNIQSNIDGKLSGYSHTSFSDRSFFRALVHHEYTTRQEEIARKQLLVMQENTGEVPYTLFDFAAGGCEIEVGPLEDVEPEFAFDAEQAAASGGRMQLHLLTFFEGEDEETRPFPLRSADAEFINGLRAIAESLPKSPSPQELEECFPRVWELINTKAQVTH